MSKATAAGPEAGEGRLGVDGDIVLYHRWQRPPAPRALAVVVHGVGEHVDRYLELEAALVARGIACHGYDQRGHGRSSGARGHVDRFQSYVTDLERIVETACAAAPNLPLFLFGHSMGSIVVLQYALQRPGPLRGLVLSACPVSFAAARWRWLRAITALLAPLVPRLPLPNRIDPRQLSTDPQERARYADDARVHGTVTARWLAEFSSACSDTLERAPTLTLPVLALHGQADPVAHVAGARALLHRLASADKCLRELPGVLHEPLHAPLAVRTELAHLIASWICERA